MSHDLKNLGLATRAIHAGQYSDPTTGAVAPPIYQSSTFAFENCAQGAARFAGKEGGYIYTRMGNPTTARLEEAVNHLEGGCGGIATGSGMAALNTIVFGLLGKGDHVVATGSMYGPSRMVFERDWSRFGVESTFVDTSKEDLVREAMRPNTKLLVVETPANPTIVLTDIAKVAAIAHERGAILAVDNTFASPILQRPISLGADVVYHSMTKFINGHTDVVGGMVIAATDELNSKLRQGFAFLGGCVDPHQAWLALRGFKTLALRVRACQSNAQVVARWLEEQPVVEWVRYPGLESHPQYELAKKQMDGPGALISFEIKGGVEAGAKMLDRVELATLAVSLGGIETLIQHPASMTHATMPRESRLQAGITDGLVRVSVGCEEPEDIIADFSKALGL